MRTSENQKFHRLGYSLPGFMLLVAHAGVAVAQTLATVPIPALNSGTAPVPTNLMFIIDDSTSMSKEWVHDSLRTTTGVGNASICRSYLLPNLGESPELNTLSCFMGDPPLAAFSINKIYFNPAAKYKPPIDGNGSNTTYGSADPAGVKPDAYNLASAAAVLDIVHKFPESVFCDSKTAVATDTAHCKRNGLDAANYQNTTGGLGFPNASFPYQKTRLGAPYYYIVNPVEYCRDAGLRRCGSTTKTPAYPFEAYARYCNSTAAVNRAAGDPLSEWTYSPGATPPANTCQASYVFLGTGSPFNFTRARYGNFVRVDIDPTDSVSLTNFANWYAYYRTRLGVVKAALSFGLQALDANYRIGYMGSGYGLTSGLPTASPLAIKLLPVQTFDTTGRQNLYNKLFSHPYGTGKTNLHNPVALAGMYFAGTLSTLSNFKYKDLVGVNQPVPDPVQQSCQANYSVLVTDGVMLENAGGYKVDGSTLVGNQDGAGTPAPFCDSCKSGVSIANTLADVTQYYRTTDLRPAMPDNVPTTARDKGQHQHMATYTIGIGVSGNLTYSGDYETNSQSDYQQILNGNWDWPAPVLNTSTTVDDLWHAAVNGAGIYRVTSDIDSTTEALKSIIGSFGQIGDETAAGVAVSTPNFSADNNTAIISSFRTPDWWGELKNVTLNNDDGTEQGTNWKASETLDQQAQNADSRTIYMRAAGGAPLLKAFSWSALDATEKLLFDPAKLSHFASLNAFQQTTAAMPAGGNLLVDYLRGKSNNQAANNETSPALADPAAAALFRNRVHILGDIASSEAVIVDKPNRGYADPGYKAFKSATVRTASVYVGANDGMLHAFNASTGAERWAYIPSMVMKNLYKLANKNYATTHQFFVDGTPVTDDVCVSQCAGASAQWKTILVGGLNAGGRGFYALDITNDTPKLLWEFSAGTGACLAAGGSAASGASDCDLGYSYGNPVITKLDGGRWVVLLTSGYVNGNGEVPNGSGRGYLYVLDAATGDILNKIPAGSAGSPSNPAGLARINAFVDDPEHDNTALRVYGGDLLGNLWRFEDPSSHKLTATTTSATLLAQLKIPQGDGTTKPQPVTTRPELGKVGGKLMVYVGTGRLLGPGDLGDTVQQSFYGIKDDLGAGFGDVHNNSQLTKLSVSQSGVSRTVLSADSSQTHGWFFDFKPDNISVLPGERLDTDPTLNLGTLTFTTHVPPTDQCTQGTLGTSFHYSVSATDGKAVADLLTGMASRSVVVKTAKGKIVSLVRVSKEIKIGGDVTLAVPVKDMSAMSSGRRISWREILTK